MRREFKSLPIHSKMCLHFAGSSSDAMDIEEDEAPSSSTILVNTPVMSGPGGTSRSELTQGAANSLMKPYYSTQNQIKLDNITSGQTTIARQVCLTNMK